MPDDTPLLEALERARRLGVLGPGPVAEHLRHARRFVDALVEVQGSVLDLGSGGGLPGLVVAWDRPDLAVTLLDAQEKRVDLLQAAVDGLELGTRVSVVQGRAEVLAHQTSLRHRFAAVTARSFGPPAVVAECAVGFLATDADLLVSEPPDRPDRWDAAGLDLLGLEQRPTVEGLARFHAVRVCADQYPRRVGIPAKRPLF